MAPVYYWMHACFQISVVFLVKPKESMKEKLVTVSSLCTSRGHFGNLCIPPTPPPLVEWMEEAGKVVFGGEFVSVSWMEAGGGKGRETEVLCK